ncbi:MAG: PQQ-binding-like beta-propeller repeat protein [Pyrinomonadaceae bacterium]
MPRSLRIQLLLLAIFSTLAVYAEVRAQPSPDVELDPVKCWTYSLGDMVGERLSADDTLIYFGTEGGRVDALTIAGKKVWSSEFGGAVTSNLESTEAELFVVTSSILSETGQIKDGTLRSVTKPTGLTTWTVPVGDAERYFLRSYKGSVIVVTSNGVIYSVDAKTGSMRWRREISKGFAAAPYFSGTAVFIAGLERQVFKIKMETGEIEAMTRTAYGVTALGETWLGGQITGDERGNLTSIDRDSGKANWRFKTGGAIAGISTRGSNLLVISNDNFVYLIESRNGEVIWKKRFSGRVAYSVGLQKSYVATHSIDQNVVLLTETAKGRGAGQIRLPWDEKLTDHPIYSGDSLLMITDKALYAYSTNGCSRARQAV